MRAHTNISIKTRRSLTLSELRGADLSSSPLCVQSNRAVDMSNWICENGTNRKRHGWVQVLETLNGRINGIFPYRGDGGEVELLVHAGTAFYRICREGGKYVTKSVRSAVGAPFADERTQAFYRNDGLYIVGGGGYYRYEYRNGIPSIGEIEPYIPTTTVSIDTVDTDDTVRASLDPVNLLTAKRKNTLVGVYRTSEADTADGFSQVWQLDGLVNYYELVTVEIQTATETDVRTLTLTNRHTEVDANGQAYKTLYENAVNMNLYGDGNTTLGYLSYRDGKTLLSLSDKIDTAPPISGEANITVTFTHSKNYGATPSDRSSRIKGCRFGTLFGVGGNGDRLFLSGNPDYPNTVFFSEANDFTYFPDTFTATVGTNQSAVTGFLRLSDNTLAIFKEPSAREPAVYYQTGEYRSFYDGDGNLLKITPVFGVTAGAVEESAINPHTTVNFAGDALILSSNGVFAIEPTSNVLTDVRTARERSFAIRERLTRQAGLSDAVAVAYRGRYYLAVDDTCYVADARYVYQTESCLSYCYEWWIWEHVPTRVWAVVEDELWFGTADGRICRFDTAYTDRTFDVSAVGDLTAEFAGEMTGRLAYNPLSWTPLENDRLIIKSGGTYALYCEALLRDGVFYASAGALSDICDGDTVCVGALGEEQAVTTDGISYTVSDVDRVRGTFTLVPDDDNVDGLRCENGAVTLLRPVSGCLLYVTDVDDRPAEEDGDGCSFALKLTARGDALRLVIVPEDLIAERWRYENVVARWYTPYFDMGTNESSKTLLKLTVSQLPRNGGKLSFGYETATSADMLAAKGSGVFSFESLDFTDFSFGGGFQSSYSVKVKENNFNYIMFRFVSDSDEPCSINDLMAIYKINKRNLGVV